MKLELLNKYQIKDSFTNIALLDNNDCLILCKNYDRNNYFFYHLICDKVNVINIDGFENKGLELLKIGNKLALLCNLEKLLILNHLFEIDYIVELPSFLEKYGNIGENHSFHPNMKMCLTNSNLIPIMIWDILCPYYRWLAILEYNEKEKTANWNLEKLISLNSDDFPKSFKVGKDLPIFNHGMILNGKIYIATIGPHLMNYLGQSYFAIAEIDFKGNCLEILFTEGSYTVYADEKKRGKLSTFTSSHDSCILTSAFQKTDNWNGKQKLFTLNDKLLYEINLPRGYTKFEIIEHYKGVFWAKFFNKKVREFEIASFKVL